MDGSKSRSKDCLQQSKPLKNLGIIGRGVEQPERGVEQPD
jgi:hypothetical protein